MLKRWLPWILKLALTGGLLWILFTEIELGLAYERAKQLSLEMGVVALALLMGQAVIATVRWHVVIRALRADLALSKALSIVYMGLFFNLVLPGTVGGDAVRIWKARQAGLSLAQALNSVILERVVTVFGLVLLVALTVPLLVDRIGADNPALPVIPVLVVIAALGVAVLMSLDRLPGKLLRWRLVRGLVYLAGDTRRLFLSPRPALSSTAFAILGHVNLSLIVFSLAVGMAIDVTVWDCLVLVPPVILLTTLPISIAGWGVREGAMVAALGYVNVAEEAALALSIMLGLISIVASLPGGAFWLADRGRQFPASGETVSDGDHGSASS